MFSDRHPLLQLRSLDGRASLRSMRPLVLLPCSASKRLASTANLEGACLQGVPESERSRVWRANMAAATTRVPVRELYKGGAWSVSLRAAELAEAMGGSARVVSAGLGLVSLEETAPGYDITFVGSGSNAAPGARTSVGREEWWTELDGSMSLSRLAESGRYDVILCALPSAYVDAASRALRRSIEILGADRVTVLVCKPTLHAVATLGANLVSVEAQKTTVLGGSAGQASLIALVHILTRASTSTDLHLGSVRSALASLESRTVPLYPKRQRVGQEHARAWLINVLEQSGAPTSASQALKRYRDAGFALEQKNFHALFAAVIAGG